MDAVAAAAGVGKGTLFRAFGDRDGLLDALSESGFVPVREAGEPDGQPAGSRIVTLLTAVLTYKLEHRAVLRAREAASGGTLGSDRYRWTHELLVELLLAASGTSEATASYLAHALLAPLQIDTLDAMLAGGSSREDLQREQTAHITFVLNALNRS